MATYLGLDFGEKRIGVAIGDSEVKFAHPLVAWREGGQAFDDFLRSVIAEHSPDGLVVGLPRGLEGQNTAQTQKALEFAQHLKDQFGLRVETTDEALTSEVASERLKPSKRDRQAGAVDAEAAAIILQDFLNTL